MDLQLIAGDFLQDDCIAKDKQWLLKYFKNEQQRRFIIYSLAFGNLRDRSPGHFYRNFIDHTGEFCTKRAMQKWHKKLNDLEKMVRLATENTDLEALDIIKSGRFRFKSHGKKSQSRLADG